MHFTTTTAALLAGSSLVLALPTTKPTTASVTERSTSSGNFYIYSSTGNGGSNPLNAQPIVANSTGFYINRATSSYCPSSVGAVCPPGNTTVLAIGGTGTVSLDVMVPGGQQIFVAPTDGALSFTQAHSASMPEGSLLSTWKYTSDYGENTWGDLEFSPDGSFPASFNFFACPVGDGSWQVKYHLDNVTYPSDCEAIDLLTWVYNGSVPAWQYI